MKYYYNIKTSTFGNTYGFLYLNEDNIPQFSHSTYLTNNKSQTFNLSVARAFERVWNNSYINNKEPLPKSRIMPYVNNNKRT